MVEDETRPSVLVIGDIEAARLACSALSDRNARVTHLPTPSDQEVRAALAPERDAVAILLRNEVTALRYALLVAHLRPGIRLVVTMFDRTLSAQLKRAVANCEVTSPADIAVPTIIGACLSEQALAVYRSRHGLRILQERPGGPESVPYLGEPKGVRTIAGLVRGQLRPQDDASRIMVAGFAGLVAILAADWLLGMVFLGQGAIDSFYSASRVVATVGPGVDEQSSPSWYLVVSGVFMLAAIAFTAVFTAGIVNRLLSSRSIALLGRRTLPRRDHVVVVGLGQVGLRLATKLATLGHRVVVVERNPSPSNLRIAKAVGIPVVIGNASERAVLERLALRHARALAAMGSQDLDNVEVAITARAVAPDLAIVLRAGEDDAIAETQSLFAVGQVRDVSALTAAAVALGLTSDPPEVVYARAHHVCAYRGDSELDVDVTRRCTC
jgi:voltage-gated potassium channel Kch